METATFGSESSAARTATEQIIDLRTTLRYLGVPISESSYLFGDNKTVVDSGSLPHAKLHKRHTMLSDKISTSLVECEHVKAKIGKALRADGSPRMWKKLPPARGQKGFLS